MSIPLDFLGLNNIVVKKPGFEKNQIFNNKDLKDLQVDNSKGVNFTIKELLPSESDSLRNSKHIVSDSSTVFRYDHRNTDTQQLSALQNFTISIDFERQTSLTSTNWGNAKNQLSEINEIQTIICNTDSSSKIVGQQTVSTPGVNGIGIIRDNSDSATRIIKLIFFKRTSEELTLAQFDTGVTGLSGIDSFEDGNQTNLNLTIVVNNLSDVNLHKSSKSDKFVSQNKRVTVYLNGIEVGLQDGLSEDYEMDTAISSIFVNEQNNKDYKINDNFFTFIRSMKSTSDYEYIRFHENDVPSNLYWIATWDKALTPEQVSEIQKIKKYNFFSQDPTAITIKQFSRYNEKTVPSPVFTFSSQELEEGLWHFSTNDPYYLSEIHTANNELTPSIQNFYEKLPGYGFWSEPSVLFNNLNGPYGYSSFKQLRASQNWLMRAYNKDSTFSFISEKGDTIVVTKDGKILSNHKTKYGEIQNFTETPVSEQHKPLEIIATISDGFDDEKLSIKGTYSNETQFFKNKVINVETSRELDNSETYEDLKALTDKETTPLKSFDKLTLKQSVFPKNIYTHSRNHRTRPTYSSKIWRDRRSDRNEIDKNAGFGACYDEVSFWPLDPTNNFESAESVPGYESIDYVSSRNSGIGVLQSSAFLGTTYNPSQISGRNIDEIVATNCCYNRPHTITSSTSVKNPFFTNLSGSNIGNVPKYQGQAAWEAGSMAGFFNTNGDFQLSSKQPFPDSYDKWSESFRGLGKGYSVIPEFRISDHINHYLTNGFTSQKLDFLDVKGGNLDYTNSSDQDFFKVYSTTDFLKNFEIIKEDFENKATPTRITLRCKAIKKFLPYEGFYPCQRTVDLAKQFYDSYGFFISGSSWNQHIHHDTVESVVTEEASNVGNSKFISQNLLTPLFAPGVLFNSIKSGIACDFPIMTSEYATSSFGPYKNFPSFSFRYMPGSGPAGSTTTPFLEFDAVSGTGQTPVVVELTASTTSGETNLGGGRIRIEFDHDESDVYSQYENLSSSLNNSSLRHNYSIHTSSATSTKVTVTFTAKEWDNDYNITNVTESSEGSYSNWITSVNTSSAIEDHDTNKPDINYFISSEFDERIPFEALLEPEKYLANKNLFSMEPDATSLKTKSIWSGQGDNLYKLMINNFVSEVGDFFLENERHTTITSLPEGDPNFGNAQENKVYGMRIKIFRNITGSKETGVSHLGTFAYPQDTGSMGEAFTMYSRPSAFGPPARLDTGDFKQDIIGTTFVGRTWSKYKFDGSINYMYMPDGSGCDTEGLVVQYPEDGYNYTFTPPYYHGEAWCDIFFVPPSGAKKYSLAEVINNSSAEFIRYYESGSAGFANKVHPNCVTHILNDQAMQIASSMNIFSRGILREDSENLTINTQLETKYRWIIQSKWETPTLNFNYLSHEDLTMPPTNATASVPIGMWHQYGKLPQKTDEGVFVQVTDIPQNWIQNVMGGDIYTTGSLVDLCGFSTDPIRVGEIKNTKLIEEAVVAVPFVNRNGFREFFKLNKEDVHRAINGIEEAVGPTVFKLTQQLDKYVFPPQFDYKRNKDITPVAMYVFEFSHEFTKQDLADIWQNLPPKLGNVHETAEATISHALFAEEFLGTGADPKKTENGIERNIVSELTDLPSDIQWMVFKVKKRAKSNYFEKMFQRNESRDSDINNNFTVDSTGKKSDVSFNWPYDFFSMVELIKLDAEVEFSNVDEQKSKEEKKLVTKPYIFRED